MRGARPVKENGCFSWECQKAQRIAGKNESNEKRSSVVIGACLTKHTKIQKFSDNIPLSWIKGGTALIAGFQSLFDSSQTRPFDGTRNTQKMMAAGFVLQTNAASNQTVQSFIGTTPKETRRIDPSHHYLFS